MKRRDKKPLIESPIGYPTAREVEDDEAALFRDAVRDVSPLAAPEKVVFAARRPKPLPRDILDDEQTPPHDSLSDHITLGMEAGDEWAFVRPGLSRQTLRRLRRGYWRIEAQLDLHGFTRDEARLELVSFLDASQERGFRCVRVIHGKGLTSRNHEPVLKARIGNWLAQRNDVLAFSQARPEDGGSGAVLVLLKASARGT